jgi:DNA-binding MarR family transcriptional regulator
MPKPPTLAYPNPTEFAGFLTWQIANEWERHVNECLKEFGLNQAEVCHLISLFWLSLQQAEVTQVDVARFARTTAMNTSKILTRFEARGLISRTVGQDTRAKAVSLTELGKLHTIATAGILNAANNEFFGTAQSAGGGALAKMLQKILRAREASPPPEA